MSSVQGPMPGIQGPMPNVPGSMPSIQPTFVGFIDTTMDAMVVLEAALQAHTYHVGRRPHDRERGELIKSGNVFIFEEKSSGIKRWTDGVAWSPSRILDNFLIYRELDQPFAPGTKKRALKKPSKSSGGVNKSGEVRESERHLVGSLVDSYDFKEGGLIKKTISIVVRDVTHHLVSYYTVEDVMTGKLKTPNLANDLYYNLTPDHINFNDQHFRTALDRVEKLSPVQFQWYRSQTTVGMPQSGMYFDQQQHQQAVPNGYDPMGYSYDHEHQQQESQEMVVPPHQQLAVHSSQQHMAMHPSQQQQMAVHPTQQQMAIYPPQQQMANPYQQQVVHPPQQQHYSAEGYEPLLWGWGDKFKVTLLEACDVVGGQATSIPLDEKKYGAAWLNNGVQGGSPIFKHTFNFFRQQGHPPQEVQLQVSFGKGEDGFWTNCFPSTLVERFAADIKKFGTFLKVIRWTMPVLGLVPISIMLRVFLFNKEFGDKMVYPLIALFLGTGNQTANVPSAIVERLFDDPNMKLWDYDEQTLLPNLPTMVTFDHLHEFYRKWREDLEAKGVEIRTNTEVQAVLSRSNANVKLRIKNSATDETTDETFDDMVLCVLADTALRLLGKTATWREKFVLGGAAFYDDITVTHSDTAYFEKHYETHFKPNLCAEPQSADQQKQVRFARGDDDDSRGFRPMYYTYTYQEDPRLIEMSFNCSNYQHQLKTANERAGDGAYKPVYQTIFLNSEERHLWTMDEIDETKVLKRNWWHQLGHRWQHYVRVVPGMMFLHGKKSTWFAGSWTLVNMHELACVSGIAAAYRLGADYVKFDDFAEDFFSKYMLLSHGKVYSREEKKRQRSKE
ncbi:hypothetical protein G7046_g5517 [Stylonectria norvegica]|nr:hypothetical protein G7046_g5517 [Stylonectria norvegica]